MYCVRGAQRFKNSNSGLSYSLTSGDSTRVVQRFAVTKPKHHIRIRILNIHYLRKNEETKVDKRRRKSSFRAFCVLINDVNKFSIFGTGNRINHMLILKFPSVCKWMQFRNKEQKVNANNNKWIDSVLFGSLVCVFVYFARLRLLLFIHECMRDKTSLLCKRQR